MLRHQDVWTVLKGLDRLIGRIVTPRSLIHVPSAISDSRHPSAPDSLNWGQVPGEEPFSRCSDVHGDRVLGFCPTRQVWEGCSQNVTKIACHRGVASRKWLISGDTELCWQCQWWQSMYIYLGLARCSVWDLSGARLYWECWQLALPPGHPACFWKRDARAGWAGLVLLLTPLHAVLSKTVAFPARLQVRWCNSPFPSKAWPWHAWGSCMQCLHSRICSVSRCICAVSCSMESVRVDAWRLDLRQATLKAGAKTQQLSSSIGSLGTAGELGSW